MTLETDLILDRTRLSRRLVFWRTIAVLAVVVAVLVALRPQFKSGPIGVGLDGISGSHVARFKVSGIITDDQNTIDAVRQLGADRSVAGMIVSIDSPGGSVAGGEALHDAIAAVAAVKPVVAVMGGTAASAGYMVAVPAARIFARQATITGSIGVLLETGDVSGLLKTLGIATDTIVSGPLKAQPNYLRPLSPEGRDVLQGLVMDMYDQFVGMVAAGRHMDPARVRALADGRPYTGRQALALDLVDQIGGEPEARAWLAASRGVPADLPIQDVTIGSFYQRTFGASLGELGVTFWKSFVSQGVILDGAVALWQPDPR